MRTIPASTIPAALERELPDLGRFAIRHSQVADQTILTARVHGVPVSIYLDGSYPGAPPRLELPLEWSWGRGGPRIEGLYSLENWNRTLGIGTLLRELEKQFVAEPPRKIERREGPDLLVRLWRRLTGWLASLWRRIFRRWRDEEDDEASLTEAIRVRYQEVIVEKASRIERYKQAVAQLIAQRQRKIGRLEKLGRTIEQLEKKQQRDLARAKRNVELLEVQGKTPAEIKQDAEYVRCQEDFAERAAELEEQHERFAELEADADAHNEKVDDHKAQLEGMMDELQELRDEFAQVATDLTTVELEQEIVDLRAGVTRSEADEELQDLLRRFRKAKASVRITREAADRDDGAQDAEYLEVARRVTAAESFEASVGLREPGPGRRERE